MIPPGPLRQLHGLDRTSPQFRKQLSNLLRGDEYQNVVPGLQGEDLVWLVEYLNSVLGGISDPPSLEFKEFLHELGNICGVKGALPGSCMFLDTLPDVSIPFASGSTLDGSRLRIKRVKIHANGQLQKVKQAFHEVAVVWKHLAHPNIAPLLGVTIDPLQFISDRISGENLMEYIASHPDANKVTLLSDVAQGLNYLHSCDVIHGGLKGSSILVESTGRVQITDIGLVMVTQNLDSIRGASAEHEDSARWIAPEILDDRGTYSKEVDVFSFAMVTIEVFTGAVPFSDKSPHEVIVAIVGGERPLRPTDPTLTSSLWTLTQRCWNREAHLRPQTPQILRAYGIPVWKPLIDCPFAMDERISLITTIFSDSTETEVVKCLRGDDAQSFVDVIDEILDTLAPRLRRRCLSTLCRICGHQALLPRSVQIPLCYDRMNPPLYHGGYAEVWKGEHQGREVAVKVLKVYLTSDLDKITRRFCKEVMTWKALCHPNVLPLLGVTMGNKQFTMVSEWMANGNINEFVKARRDVNRFELLKDVARGLIYMHGEGMIHGDLKGANILIDKHERACLADFGLTAIVVDPAYPTTSGSSTTAGTPRWMSPERLNPNKFGLKDSRPTKESDCYAFGMAILEVLGGQVPFTRDCNDLMVMQKVLEGEHPGKPHGAERALFTDDLWRTLKVCWSPQPKDRPTIEAVLECLAGVSMAWQPLPPCTDGDVQLDTDEELFFTASYSSDQTIPQVGDQPPLLPPSHPCSTPVDYQACTGPIPPTDPLQRLYDLDRTSPEFPNHLTDILLEEDCVNLIQNLPYEDSRPFVESWTASTLPPAFFYHRLVKLWRARGFEKVLSTPNIPSDIFLDKSDRPTASGTGAKSRERTVKEFSSVGFGLRKGVSSKEEDIYRPPQSDRAVVPPTPRMMLSPSTFKVSDTMSSLPSVERLKAGDFDLDELVKKLTEALADELQRNEILQLRGDNAVLVIECLDNIISSESFRSNSDIQTRSRVFSTISRLSRGCQYLPRSYWIDPSSIALPDGPHASGTSAEVYQGKQSGEFVAVKVLRASNQESPMKLKKRFCKEAIVWKHLSCPYILKLNGVFYHNGVPAIVTPWMSHGNVTEYLKNNPEANRLRLLLGVIKGVKYLHSCNIAHGDIKAPNILISGDTSPRALLADFGFTRITTISVRMSSEEQGTVSFMAPELLFSDKFGLAKAVPSKEADIYALGMTAYQVLTGEWPFFPKRELEVMIAVISDERPPKPENAEEIGLTEAMWDLLGKCWREDRTKRPNISEILGKFREVTSERGTANSTIEVVGPRPGIAGNRNSILTKLDWRMIPASCGPETDRGSSTPAVTAPSSLYDYLDQDEISEAKENTPTTSNNAAKRNRPTIQTNYPTKGKLAVKKPETGKTSVVDPASPTVVPGCFPQEVRTKSKGKEVWNRVKQIVVRSASL
ncbi:kinase-like protein [Thelephora ganbajun]|uniref:Kinase-like protein n=1 Tax=Thelephora ganbajun TaxID=370292 RepID=A0ACB6ZF38_THEGA|nr:kinase-like protein [Thelephora ganbajun]